MLWYNKLNLDKPRSCEITPLINKDNNYTGSLTDSHISGEDQVMVGIVPINTPFSASRSYKAIFPIAVANRKKARLVKYYYYFLWLFCITTVSVWYPKNPTIWLVMITCRILCLSSIIYTWTKSHSKLFPSWT